MEIAFADLKRARFNLVNISAVERTWSNQNVNRHRDGRNLHILSLTLKGKKNFWTPDFEKMIASLEAPSATLITKGTPYFSQTVAEDELIGQTICVEFEILDDTGQPFTLTDKFLFWDSLKVLPLIPAFKKIVEDYLQPDVNYFTLQIDVLKLLRSLTDKMNQQTLLSPKLQFLQPAIDYLKHNPDKKASVSELAKMCAVSESYFRASFIRFSGGISVTKYRNILRVEKARELLASSLWTTAMVAEVLGFYDVSHFYRVYKSVTGELPKSGDADNPSQDKRSDI